MGWSRSCAKCRRRPGRLQHEADARGALGANRAALVGLGALSMFVTKPYHDGNIEVVTNAREFIIERIERLAASERVGDDTGKRSGGGQRMMA